MSQSSIETKLAKFYQKVEYNKLTLSYSALRALLISPSAFRRYKMRQVVQSQAMIYGILVHTLVLEPEMLLDRFIVRLKVDRRTKIGKALWSQFLAEAEGKYLISQDELDKAKDARSRILKNTRARALMDSAFELEQDLMFVHDGIPFRGKRDIVGCGYVGDLKTCPDTSTNKLKWNIRSSSLDLQAHIYTMQEQEDYYLLFVDDKETRVVQLSEESLKWGAIKFDSLMETYKRLRFDFCNWRATGAGSNPFDQSRSYYDQGGILTI